MLGMKMNLAQWNKSAGKHMKGQVERWVGYAVSIAWHILRWFLCLVATIPLAIFSLVVGNTELWDNFLNKIWDDI